MDSLPQRAKEKEYQGKKEDALVFLYNFLSDREGMGIHGSTEGMCWVSRRLVDQR